MVRLCWRLPVRSTFMLTFRLLQVVLTYTRLLTLTGVPVILPLSQIRKVHTLMSQIIHVLLQSLSSSDSILAMLSLLCLLQFVTFLATASKTSFGILKKLWLFLLSLKKSHAVSLTPEQQQQLLEILAPLAENPSSNEEVNTNAEQSFHIRH